MAWRHVLGHFLLMNDKSDALVTPERSLFGTRVPRPIGVGRHLVVVLIVSAVALGLAVVFAERAAPSPTNVPVARP
jgi:hypothetical protein